MLRCSYVFPDGRPCRATVSPNRSLCRHHTAEAVEERASRITPPPMLDENSPRSDYAAYWHGYHAVVLQSDESDFDDILANILSGLEQEVLSDRSAGRLLHTLVRRRRQLHEQRLVEHFMHIAEQHRANQRPATTSAWGPHDLLVSEGKEPWGPQDQKATQ